MEGKTIRIGPEQLSVARIFWDNNLLHSDEKYAREHGNRARLCPGTYILSEAELMLGLRGRKNFGLSGGFKEKVLEGDSILLVPNEGGLRVIRIGDEKEVAAFKVYDLVAEANKLKEDFPELQHSEFEIDEERIKRLNDVLKADCQDPSHIFSIGAPIASFLAGNSGVMITNLDFRFYGIPRLGAIKADIKYEKKSKSRLTIYNVYASSSQGEKLTEGNGRGLELAVAA